MIGSLSKRLSATLRAPLNVLDFSRIQNGQLKPVLEAFEPIVLAGKVAAMFDSRLSARGIALHTEYDTSCGRVIGDAARVLQVSPP